MRVFLGRRGRAVLLLAVIGLAAGCGSNRPARVGPANASTAQTGAVGRVSAEDRRGPFAVVSVAHACPQSLGRVVDVDNDFSSRARALLPNGEPVDGLICVFTRRPQDPFTSTRLRRSVRLDHDQTRSLVAAIDAISLAPAHGAFSCPADLGNHTVIAVRYRSDLTVDLWYQTTGCETLDNGTVLAFSGANPSFYQGFARVYGSLVPTS